MKRILFLWMFCLFLSACAFPKTSSSTAGRDCAVEFNEAQYLREKDSAGIVLISVNWSRKWNCGEFENAQLKKLAFDNSDSSARNDTSEADLVLENPSIISSPPVFTHYAYLLPPGRYLLSGFKVKVARSINEVGFFDLKRSDLRRDGKLSFGSFDVGPGQAVYIGHFFIDCAAQPIPWRFYLENHASFNQYLNEVEKKYSSLPAENVKFRLFQTDVLGHPFSLDN
jgi:hypothetical protein